MTLRTLTALLCLALALPAAAFTYDNRTLQSGANLRDSDQQNPADRLEKNGFSLRFSGNRGVGTPPDRDSRFLPSANNAFNTPFSAPNNFDNALDHRYRD